MCVNSASTVLGGAGNNSNGIEHKTLARSSRVRQGVSRRHVVDGFCSYLEKPVYSTKSLGAPVKALC